MKYFDCNATTPLNAASIKAYTEALTHHWHNPSGPYRKGAHVHNLLEKARLFWAGTLGTEVSNIIFTSGATESANALFRYFRNIFDPSVQIGISAIEHPCISESANYFFKDRCTSLPVTPVGVLDLISLEAFIKEKQPKVITLMALNNETGIIQSWKEVSELCQKHGIIFVCDATQWLGKYAADKLGICDFVIGSGHKFGGPKGKGILKIPSNHNQFKMTFGGNQESGHRAGTENYPAIAGMTAAYEFSIKKAVESKEQLISAKNEFEKTLLGQISGIKILGASTERSWNTSSLIMPKYANTRWLNQLDKQGFSIGIGSACGTRKDEASPTLNAMGLTESDQKRFLRISSSWETSKDDWAALVNAFLKAWECMNAEDLNSDSQVIEI